MVHSTGIGKGFGYVLFKSEESVAKAMRLNGRDVGGRHVRVSKSVRKCKSAAEHKLAKKQKKKLSRQRDDASRDGKQFKRKDRGANKKKSFQGENTNKMKENKRKKPSASVLKHRKNAKILNK